LLREITIFDSAKRPPKSPRQSLAEWEVANSRNLIGTIQNVIQLRIRLPWHTVYCQLLFWADYLREVKSNSRRAYYRPAHTVNTGRPHLIWDCKGKIVFNESKEKIIFNVQFSTLNVQVIDSQKFILLIFFT
jgi:hypothetical protein